MRSIRLTLAWSVALAGVLALGLVTQAQAQEATQPPTQGQTPLQENFSKEQLKSFTAASEAIQKVAAKYSERLQNTGGRAKKSALQEEAQYEMIRAVQDHGLTLDTFNAIGLAARSDPELLERIRQLHGS